LFFPFANSVYQSRLYQPVDRTSLILTLENDIVIGGGSRKEWPNQFQFMCANIAFAVGLGNIWRFPYLAQTNGGGTFLIPYFISLFIIGFPILVLELSLGQRLRCGASGAYTKFHKGFLGVGLAMSAVSAFVALYYNVIVAWAFYYFLSSFQVQIMSQSHNLNSYF
jgi:solute carrier family 6 amino acid/orphan transporter-like 15/16/17/18/20